MKSYLFPALLVITALYLSACAGPNDLSKKKGTTRYGYDGEQPIPADTQTTPPPITPAVTSEPPTKTQDTGTPIPPPPVEPTKTQTSSTPPQTKDYPYGASVPNKPGFVTSPHAPYAGYVDVRGIPTGTPVKDPYTGKIFLVP